MASAIQIREWARLAYYDPRPIMLRLRDLGSQPWIHDLPYLTRSLRTRELREHHERRLGTIFFYLMGQAEQTQVLFAHSPHADYDFVGRFERDSFTHFVPVQMKEFAPAFLNPNDSLQGVINALKTRYPNAADLTVAININREGTHELANLDLTGLAISGLWLFGAVNEDQSIYRLIGNMMKENWHADEFAHP